MTQSRHFACHAHFSNARCKGATPDHVVKLDLPVEGAPRQYGAARKARWEIKTSELRWTGTGLRLRPVTTMLRMKSTTTTPCWSTQSGERIRGRLAIRTTRGLLPNKHFAIRRVIGRGDLWVTEYVISCDGKPSHTVSVMEFRDGKVFRETQYFGDPFEPWSGRAQWVEPIDY